MTVTLDELAAAITTAASESAQTNQTLQTDVLPRLERLENIAKDSGLNGHTPLLKAFLEQYGATYVRRQAYLTVRSDLAHRLRIFRQPRAWIKAFFYAVLGGLGWQMVSHPPHVPGLH